jgi:hypothetical protein
MMIKRLKRSKLRSTIFLGLSTCMILISGCLTLLWHVQEHHTTHADGGNVIGPPSLPAATIDAIFTRAGSPMAGTGKVVEQIARQANIDDAFALGVWWAETNDGMAGVGRGDRNPGAVRGSPDYPAARDSYTLYPSYSVAIADWFKILKSRYVSRGLTSVYTICYPYVGTAGSASWAAKVVSYMYRYRGETPPAPTVASPHHIPSHKPYSISANDKHKTIDVRPKQTTKSTVAPPIVTSQSAQVQQSVIPVRSSTNQLPLMAFGLLASLVIALYARKIRRVPTPLEPATGTLASSMPQPLYVNQYSPALSPLFTNEYSPVIERNTTTLFSPEWSHSPFEVEQQFFTASARVTSIPTLPTTPLPAIHESFVNHHQAEIRPHRIRLRRAEETAAIASETLAASTLYSYDVTVPADTTTNGAHLQPHTEALQHPHPVVLLPNKVPVHINTSGGGLLSRYRLEQANQNL